MATRPKRSPCCSASSTMQAAVAQAWSSRDTAGRARSACPADAVASTRIQIVTGLSRSDSRTKKRSERAYSFQSIWRSSSPGS